MVPRAISTQLSFSKLRRRHLSHDWGFPDSLVGKESACNAGDASSIPEVGKICWRRDGLPTPVFLDFFCGSAGKESTCNVGNLGSITGLGRSPREGKGYPLQYSGLENTIDWIVHGVTKSWIQLSNFHFQRRIHKPSLPVDELCQRPEWLDQPAPLVCP